MSAAAGALAPAQVRPVAETSRWGIRIATIVLCIWVLLPLYLLFVNALTTPDEVVGWPKRFAPSFDTESLSFFWNYAGVVRALINSILVAGLTMILSIGIGAPAGYALARFRFWGKDAFRLLVVMTRAFPLPLLKPSLQTALILRTILAFEVFAIVLVLAGTNLPILMGETFNWQFALQDSEGAAAYAMVILVISIGFAVFFLYTLGERKEVVR